MKHCLFFSLLFLALLIDILGAHGGGKTEPDRGLQPLITTSELAVGQNRFAFGLLKSHKLVEGADVGLRLYSVEEQEAHLVGELQALYQPLDGIKRGPSPHRHSDGTRHMDRDEAAVRGLYVAQITFGRPGPWGIEILANQGNGLERARIKVTVLDSPLTPLLGSHAPRSRSLVASDVRDLREIDTTQQPDPRLHRVRIVDTFRQGKPEVIVFATRQFCASRMCGPVVDVVRKLLPTYGNRVVVTQQEIWEDFARQKILPVVKEWRLHSEPWVFMVDAHGVIRAKFEGLVTVQELEDALERMLMRGTPRRQ